MRPILMLAAALLVPAAVQATPDDLRNIATMRGRSRVLLVFAPSLGDARLRAQQREMARFGAGAATRDLVLVQVGGDTVLGARDRADRLRVRYRIPAGGYRAILIGKDGHPAATGEGVFTADALRRRIDAMPMRQEEMRRAQAGLGRAR